MQRRCLMENLKCPPKVWEKSLPRLWEKPLELHLISEQLSGFFIVVISLFIEKKSLQSESELLKFFIFVFDMQVYGNA